MKRRHIVFLDRDGVVNVYPGDRNYVTSWRGFRFIRGVKSALRRLTEKGFELFIVSNQAGVAKGIYSRECLNDITERMLARLGASGVKIAAVYYCTHHPDARCRCRKPDDGLLRQAAAEFHISRRQLRQSFMVGDSYRDVCAGKKAGCRTILVFSGKEKRADDASWSLQPDLTAHDLPEAVRLILKECCPAQRVGTR